MAIWEMCAGKEKRVVSCSSVWSVSARWWDIVSGSVDAAAADAMAAEDTAVAVADVTESLWGMGLEEKTAWEAAALDVSMAEGEGGS
mmetsp:Transcript_27267/g.57374  ORF Transcript_27267/g.57374 Transcript_27267/m.57374 type:complete len:87 (+) Transcript_27267:239-499(+)